MPSLGDVYVDVHANTRGMKREIRDASTTLDKEGAVGGKAYGKGFNKSASKEFGAFEGDMKRSIDRTLKSISQKHVDIDSLPAQKKLAVISAELRALHGNIGVEVDSKEALARIGLLRAELATLKDHKDIQVRVDARRALFELGAIKALTSDTSVVGAATRAAGKSIGFLTLALGGLIAAAGPAVAALGGVALALAAPIGAVGGGGILFGVIAGKYIKSTLEQAAAGKKLTASQKAFVASFKGFKTAAASFATLNSKALLGPFTQGLQILTRLMPSLTPVISSISKALTGLLTDLDNSGALERFVNFLKNNAGNAITVTGHLIGNMTSSLGRLFGQAMPLGISILSGLSNAFGRFDKYLQSAEGRKQVQQFLDWVRTNGPIIGKAFLQIGKFLIDAFKFASPFIVDATKALGDFASIVSDLLGWLKPLNKEISALALGMLLLKGRAVGAGAALGAEGAVAGATRVGKLRAAFALLGKRIALVALAIGAFKLGKFLTEGIKATNDAGHALDGLASKYDSLGRAGKGAATTIATAIGSNSRISFGLQKIGIDVDALANSMAQSGTKSEVYRTALERLNKLQNSWNPITAVKAGDAIIALEKLGAAADGAAAKAPKLQAAFAGQLITNLQLMGQITSDVAARLRDLPPSVAIQVLTPGAVKSLDDVVALANSFHLIKPQIKTVLEMAGIPATQANLDLIQAKLLKLQEPAAIQLLVDLGLLDADLGTARSHVEGLAPFAVGLTGDPTAFNTELKNAKARGDKTVATTTLKTNPRNADATTKGWKGRADKTVGIAHQNAEKSQGDKVTAGWKTGADKTKGTAHLHAEDSHARGVVSGFVHWASNLLSSIHIPRFAAGGPIPTGYAHGGRIPGATPANKTFDNVAGVTRKGNPIRVQSGEWIINSQASKQNEKLLAAINSGFNAQRALGMSSGGLVPVRQKKHEYASGGQVADWNSQPTVVNNNVQQIFTGPTTGSRRNRELDWTLRFATSASAAAGGAGGMN